jgi:hypothetical protein
MITREDIDQHFADWQARGVMTSVKLDWESGTAEVIYDLHAMLAEANRYKLMMETQYLGWTGKGHER